MDHFTPSSLEGPVSRSVEVALGAREDETTSFEDFFERERDNLFGLLVLATGDRQEAEDLAQDAFVAIWEQWDRVSRVDNPAGYLHRTAMNAFRKRYRRAQILRRVTGSAAGQTTARLVPGTGLVVVEPSIHLSAGVPIHGGWRGRAVHPTAAPPEPAPHGEPIDLTRVAARQAEHLSTCRR
jgi:DNA-directed RNA polymerase specialized sigma24 family protein